MNKEYTAEERATARAQIEARRAAFRKEMSEIAGGKDKDSVAAENMQGANDLVMYNGALTFRKDVFNSRD